MKQDNFLHKSDDPLKNKNPLVSVIIPAYNEEGVIFLLMMVQQIEL